VEAAAAKVRVVEPQEWEEVAATAVSEGLGLQELRALGRQHEGAVRQSRSMAARPWSRMSDHIPRNTNPATMSDETRVPIP